MWSREMNGTPLIKVSEGEVRSPSGYSVKISRGQLRYVEGDGRYVTLDADYVTEERVLHIYVPSAGAWMVKGRVAQALTSDDIALITDRISACLRVLNLNGQVHTE